MASATTTDSATEKSTNTTEPSARKRFRLPALLLLCGLSLSFVIATGKPQPQPGPPAAPTAPLVEFIVAEPQARPITVTTQGTLTSRREAVLTAQVSGAVVEVNDRFARGQQVDEGDVLLQIDSRDYAIAVKEASAQLADARQLLAVEQGRTRQAKREWRDLGSTEANDLFLRKPQLASAEAAATAAQAKLERAQLNLERARITAPFAGVIQEVSAQLGEYLPIGGQIGSLIDTRQLELRLPVSSPELTLMPPLSEGIDAVIAGGQDVLFETRITRLEAAADPQSRFLYLVADLQLAENPSSLFAGQFVEARLSGKRFERTISIPVTALRARDQIWLLDQNDQLAITNVQLLARDDDEVIVAVDEGAGPLRVVTSYIARPSAGMALRFERD